MRQNIKNIIILFVIVINFSSCLNNEKKEIIENEEIIKNESTQKFKINSYSDTIIKGIKGTTIMIDSGTFKGPQYVTIELREYYSIYSFLIEDLTTTSDENLIESKGMFYIDIANRDSFVIDFKRIKVNFPTLTDDDLEVKPEDSVFMTFMGEKKDKRINWKPSSKPIYKKTYEYNKNIYFVKYENVFSITDFGWVNLDKFIDVEEKCDLFVEVQNKSAEIQYSLVFYSINSIIGGYRNNNQIEFKGIPKDEKVSLIGFGVIENKLYYNILDLTTDTKGAKFPELLPVNQEDLEKIFNEKFGNDLTNRPVPKW